MCDLYFGFEASETQDVTPFKNHVFRFIIKMRSYWSHMIMIQHDPCPLITGILICQAHKENHTLGEK